ncbi:MAG TPA: PP2C family protein-serine/threonine phosphatase [Marmoricola sp.]|nr:PP2C family protein-serine/threonine phosphatase [Marmoricola sp.]
MSAPTRVPEVTSPTTSRTHTRQRGGPARRWLHEESRWFFAFLVALTFVIAALMLVSSDAFTAATLLVPLLLTDSLMPPRRVPTLVATLVLVMFVETAVEFSDGALPARRWVGIVLVLGMAVVVVALARRRARLGVAGYMGDSMLLDLQGRINRQGRIPALPHEWYIDVATRSAGGTSFAGDFIVANRDEERDALSLVLVDVSGKGVDAGTRSLLLSGALGGLLGALPPAEFLPSANEFLLRQGWDEGFATAVHLDLDLCSGRFEVRTAGHPPAIQLRAGSGRWGVQDQVDGPALGLVPDAVFTPGFGQLGRGDVLMLYTDGLVERRRRDIGLGIDRLIGEGERLVRTGFRDSAAGLVHRLGASSDDCALAVVHRL